MKKVQFVHHFGDEEYEKDVETIEFPDNTTDEEIQGEFEQFVWEKIGDDFYWEEEE